MIKRFLIALQFLTILPVKVKDIRDDDYRDSLPYFPAAGLIIGLLLVVAAKITSAMPNMFTAAAILTVSVLITGGLHLDGFADTCDAFYGVRTRKERLDIMRDSRIGAMGAMGITLLLLWKFVLIVSIAPAFLWRALIMTTTFSRWAQVLACAISKYAREEGKGGFFIGRATIRDTIAGGLFTLSLFLIFAGITRGVIIYLTSTVFAALFTLYANKKIGGMTGDTVGAVSEIAEVLVLSSGLIIVP